MRTLRMGMSLVGIAALGVLLAGCPNPGAIGTQACLGCHNGHIGPDRSGFKDSPHKVVGCEACHGPGYLHAWVGGLGGLFIRKFDDLPFARRSDLCNQCHPLETAGYRDSQHAASKEVECLSCHGIHDSKVFLLDYTNNALCLSCHQDDFPTPAALTAHTFHPVDPSGTGASRCVGCHMVSLRRTDQATAPHNHTFKPVQPQVSADAVALGVVPVPANSCAGTTGCHDGTVAAAPVFDVTDQATDQTLQAIFDSRYGTVK